MMNTTMFGTKKRVSKSSKIVCALGALDEANSYLGVVHSAQCIVHRIEEMQKNLMTISSIIAGAKLNFPAEKVTDLEGKIAKLKAGQPKLDHFILPKGELMFARALVRRAERECVSLFKNLKLKNKNYLLDYLNRLSTYLFYLSLKEVH